MSSLKSDHPPLNVVYRRKAPDQPWRKTVVLEGWEAATQTVKTFNDDAKRKGSEARAKAVLYTPDIGAGVVALLDAFPDALTSGRVEAREYDGEVGWEIGLSFNGRNESRTVSLMPQTYLRFFTTNEAIVQEVTWRLDRQCSREDPENPFRWSRKNET